MVKRKIITTILNTHTHTGKDLKGYNKMLIAVTSTMSEL